MSDFLRPFKSAARPRAGDLVLVDSANAYINVYRVSPDFSFADVVFTAKNGEMGLVLDAASDDSGAILYHYVRVLFQRGMVGIAHGGLLRIMNDLDVVQRGLSTW